jgi:hypothetical protein
MRYGQPLPTLDFVGQDLGDAGAARLVEFGMGQTDPRIDCATHCQRHVKLGAEFRQQTTVKFTASRLATAFKSHVDAVRHIPHIARQPPLVRGHAADPIQQRHDGQAFSPASHSGLGVEVAIMRLANALEKERG